MKKIIIFLVLILTSLSHAAVITSVAINDKAAYIKINGFIEKEDDKKLKDLIIDLHNKNISIEAIYLNAEDSSWVKSAKIADVISRNNLTTVVLNDKYCNGGCIQMFAAGTPRILYPNSIINAYPPEYRSRSCRFYSRKRFWCGPDIFIPAFRSGYDVLNLYSFNVPTLLVLGIMFTPPNETYQLTEEQNEKLSTGWNSNYFKSLYVEAEKEEEKQFDLKIGTVRKEQEEELIRLKEENLRLEKELAEESKRLDKQLQEIEKEYDQHDGRSAKVDEIFFKLSPKYNLDEIDIVKVTNEGTYNDDENYIKFLSYAGWKYLIDGDYKKSILYFESMIKLDPKNIDGLSGLGLLKTEMKDYKGAKKLFMFIIDIEPCNEMTWLNLGVADAYLNDIEKATNEFVKFWECSTDKEFANSAFEGFSKNIKEKSLVTAIKNAKKRLNLK